MRIMLRSRKSARRWSVVLTAMLALLLLAACGSNAAEPGSDTSSVPWDYRIVEGTVGDLVGSDMTILPDNTLLPNDNNYGTGDPIWVLQYMNAEMTTGSDEKSSVALSAWTPIKTFASQDSAVQDMKELKVSITTDVNLVGVYETTYNGETRYFAVLDLPSGNRIKQPVNSDRYTKLKTSTTASVVLEEVHDFADYDLAYAKFRGWAN